MFRRLSALSLAALAACADSLPEYNIGPPLDPQAFHAAASNSLTTVATRIDNASSFLADSELTSRLGLQLSFHEQLGAADLGRRWADALIAPETLIDQSFSALRYRIDPIRFCAALSLEQLDGASCVEVFSRAALTISLQPLPGDRLDLDLFVGSARIIELVIEPSALQIGLELDQIAPALTALGLTGDGLQVNLRGSFHARIDAGVEEHVTISAGISKTIELSSPGGFALSLPARPNALSLSLDAQMTTVYAAIDLGAISGRLPLSALAVLCETCSEEMPDRTLGLQLGAMLHRFDLNVASERLRVDSEGLGSQIVAIDLEGAPIFSLDLNDTISRALEIVARIGGDQLDLSVTPALALNLDLDLAALDGLIGEVPAWAAHERLSVRFDRAAVPRVLLPLDDAAAPSLPGLPPLLEAARLAEVASGLLTLDATSIGRSIRVAQGECLLQDPPQSMLKPVSEHPFARLRSAPCL